MLILYKDTLKEIDMHVCQFDLIEKLLNHFSDELILIDACKDFKHQEVIKCKQAKAACLDAIKELQELVDRIDEVIEEA